MGKFGADFHLSLPQTSTLQFGMGAVKDRVVARAGLPVVVKTMNLTLSFDRILMNGRPAGILLETIARIMTQLELDEAISLPPKARMRLWPCSIPPHRSMPPRFVPTLESWIAQAIGPR